MPGLLPASIAQDLWLVQLACTLFMTGLIWFVQVVHYPLFSQVGDVAFRRYEASHARRTGWVVFLPMLLELLTSLAALLPALRPEQVSLRIAIALAALVLLIWASTALLQIPLHTQLGLTPTPQAMHRLVLTNWIRTLAWTARSILLLVALVRILPLCCTV